MHETTKKITSLVLLSSLILSLFSGCAKSDVKINALPNNTVESTVAEEESIEIESVEPSTEEIIETECDITTEGDEIADTENNEGEWNDEECEIQYNEDLNKKMFSKDMDKIGHIRNMFEIMMYDETLFTEALNFQTRGYYTCYVDPNSELESAKVDLASFGESSSGYKFDDSSRESSGVRFVPAGVGRGFTLTFPIQENNGTYMVVLDDGLINQVSGSPLDGTYNSEAIVEKTGSIKDCPMIYEELKQQIGNVIPLSCQYQIGDEVTLFVYFNQGLKFDLQFNFNF